MANKVPELIMLMLSSIITFAAKKKLCYMQYPVIYC